jgi:hypothetical protein
MDSKTNSKRLKEKQKHGTVTIVGNGEEWFSFIGDLPVTEHGGLLNTELDKLKIENTKLKDDIKRLDAHVKTVTKVLQDLLEKTKREKESDGI